MRAQGSKVKGNRFELRIAKELVEAVGKPFDRMDCYRTPLSGGHPFGDQGDIVISNRLLPILPLVIECKHRRDWTVAAMLEGRKNEQGWLQQVGQAVSGSQRNRKVKLSPLLVMQGDRTETYAAAPLATFQRLGVEVSGFGRVIFPATPRGFWIMLNWWDLLEQFRGASFQRRVSLLRLEQARSKTLKA